MKTSIKMLLLISLISATFAFATTNIVAIGDGSGLAGTQNNIVSIGLRNEIPVRGVQLQIADMPDLLIPDSVWVVTHVPGFSVSYYEDNGFLNILLISFNTTLPPDSTAILQIGYSVANNAQLGQILDLVITKVIITNSNNEGLEVTPENGLFIVQDASAVDLDPKNPASYSLAQNYPNPFNPSTTIEFSLARPGWALLEIYNPLGQRIRTLIDRPMTAGNHSLQWNGLDESGRQVPAGIYFYRIRAGDFVASKTLVLVR